MKKSCLNCEYFKLSKKPPTMRSCQYQGKLVMNGAFCGCWKNCYGFLMRLKSKLTGKPLPSRSLVL